MNDLLKLQQARIEALQKELAKTRVQLAKAKELMSNFIKDFENEN